MPTVRPYLLTLLALILMLDVGIAAADEKDLRLLPTNTLQDVTLELHVNRVQPSQLPDVSTVKMGDSVTFNFSASESGYVSLWNIDTSGKVQLLFPNPYNPDMQIYAGVPYGVGGNGDVYTVKTDTPEGIENVYLLWTRNAEEQPITVNPEDLGADKKTYQLKDFMPVGRITTQNWATARAAFEVTNDGLPKTTHFLQNVGAYKQLRFTNPSGNVYLLAMGANTGGLTKTDTDAINFAAVTKSLFDPAIFHALIYPTAYRKDFESGMDWLTQNANANDTAIIYFSGHGSTLPDDSGDEKDSVDEVFVMYDAHATKYPGPEHVVRDDEFTVWVSALRTDRIIVVLDACHSGGFMKGGVESVEGRNKFFKGGLLGQMLSGFMERFTGGFDFGRGVTIVAAQEGENAIEGKDGGVMTSHLLKGMRGRQNVGKNWYDIMQATGEQVKLKTNVQPEIWGDKQILRDITLLDQ